MIALLSLVTLSLRGGDLEVAPPRTFYLAPTGDDAADGLSKGHAWRSLARVGRETLGPGDGIVLTGGATYEGGLEFKTGGTPQRPVTLRSEGRPSTILAKTGSGLTIRAGGIAVRDLILKGEATKAADDSDGILLAAPTDRRCPFVRIERVDVSGFGGSGVSMTAEKGSPNGFDDVRLARVSSHGNYGTGIITADGIAFDSGGKTFAHHGLRITDCDSSGNFGGNGIILSGVDGATVEFCRAAGNYRPDGQGLGMWAWCARRVTFRNCIASGTRAKGDGGGFDLDGGTADCTVERCLSFDNDGVGYMHCDFPSAPRTHDNAIRDSVSLNDGRREVGDAAAFGFVVWGSGLYDCRVERNLAVANVGGSLKSDNGLLFATFIRDDKTELGNQRLEGAVFRDNALVLTGAGPALVRDNFPADVKKTVSYAGNAYGATAPAFVLGPKGEDRVESVEAWRRRTGDRAGRVPERVPTMEEVARLSPRDLPAFFRSLGR